MSIGLNGTGCVMVIYHDIHHWQCLKCSHSVFKGSTMLRPGGQSTPLIVRDLHYKGLSSLGSLTMLSKGGASWSEAAGIVLSAE
jgi:hypothetical protein